MQFLTGHKPFQGSKVGIKTIRPVKYINRWLIPGSVSYMVDPIHVNQEPGDVKSGFNISVLTVRFDRIDEKMSGVYKCNLSLSLLEPGSSLYNEIKWDDCLELSTNMFASADFKLGLFKILSLWIGDSGFEPVRTWEVVEPAVVSSTTSLQFIKFGPSIPKWLELKVLSSIPELGTCVLDPIIPITWWYRYPFGHFWILRKNLLDL